MTASSSTAQLVGLLGSTAARAPPSVAAWIASKTLIPRCGTVVATQERSRCLRDVLLNRSASLQS